MKNGFKLALIAAFSVMAGIAAATQRTRAAASAEELNPRSLFIQNCARCHGSDGRANTAKGRELDAPALTNLDKSVASIERTIRNGRDDMPAFGKKLTAKQIAAIAGYVRSL
ncbi:MAG: cytochrome c [Acidobacteriota bacterium]